MDCQPQFRPTLKIILTNALTLSLLLQMKALGSQDVTILTSCSNSSRYVVDACWAQLSLLQSKFFTFTWSLPRHDPGAFPRMAPCAPSCAGLWVWGQVEFGVWGAIKLCVFVIWQTQIGPCPPCALQGELG